MEEVAMAIHILGNKVMKFISILCVYSSSDSVSILL